MRGRNKDNGEKQLLGRWGLWMGGLAGPPGDGDSRSREWGSMRKVLKQTNTERLGHICTQKETRQVETSLTKQFGIRL